MPEQPIDLMLQIWMHDERNTWDSQRTGTFQAYVYKAATRPGYDGTPTDTLYSYQSPWARFALSARYGNMTLHDGYSWGLEWGFRPEHELVRAQEIDHFSKGLKKVERSLAKFEADEGRAMTLGQEVIRAMRAIGVKQACWKWPDGRCGTGDFPGWRVVRSMEDVRYYIDSTIDACRQRQLDQAA